MPKNKSRFVEILIKYLDPNWSNAALGRAVGVRDRSTPKRWLDVEDETMPQDENLDKLVKALKITDEDDIAALYEAATGVPQLGASIQPTAPAATTPPLSPLHLEYLRSWFGQPWATVTLADILEENTGQVSLLDAYVPLRVDFGIAIVTAEHKIKDWWATPEEEKDNLASQRSGSRRAALADREANNPLPQGEMEPLRQRRWPDLDVGEAGLQLIVDEIQGKIARRRSAGQETKDGEHIWYMEAHDAASVQPHFVLLGDPGSGKSSFLRHLTLCLAGEMRRQAGDDDAPANASLAALRDWLLGAFTPVYVELRELFPAQTATISTGTLPTAETLWRHLRNTQLGGGLAPFESDLRQLFANGKAILLLDGLDEVSQADTDSRRAEIKALVAAVMRTYPKLRMIITSRPHAYRRGDWALDGFGRAEMRPLSLDRLFELAKALFPAAVGDDADARAKEFIESLRTAEKAGQLERKLYATPLFFTLLAALWLPTRQLPSSRAELLRKGVDLILKRWTRRKLPHASVADRLGVLVRDDNTLLREVLESLALKVHGQTQPGSDSTVFDASLLLGVLYDARCQVQIADVPDYLTQHAGILVSPEHGRFYFLHRSFQEHLAAAALICRSPARHSPPLPQDLHFPGGIVRLTTQQPDLWENVAQLAADELFAHPEHNPAAWQMLAKLCDPYLTERRAAAAAFLALDMAKRYQLFDVALPRFDGRQTLLAALLETARAALTDVASFTPEQRMVAGDLLGRQPTFDTRPGVGLRPDGLPDIAWIKIPRFDAHGQAGFLFHDGKRDTPHPGLPDFWIARFPVTYGQFQAFVDASDGYGNPRWQREPTPLADDRSGQNETRWRQKWPIANRPRENVTWGEATAFCRWLTAQARAHPGLLPDGQARARLEAGWSIRLPTEWEWVKAARGWDDRLYPWGGQEYQAGRANVDETEQKTGPHNLQQTSTVGLYPHGASPFGVEEMSGNVWEWCLNEYYNPDKFLEGGGEWRALRGGSWYRNPEGSSVAARFSGGVVDVNDFLGFRVVFAASP